MTAAPLSPFSTTSSNVSPSQEQHRSEVVGMSSRTFSGKLSVVNSTSKAKKKSEVMSYRQHFAERFCRFLHEQFEDPAHVAHVFKVDATTAANWWEGDNAPSGWVIGRALVEDEYRDAALRILTEAA